MDLRAFAAGIFTLQSCETQKENYQHASHF